MRELWNHQKYALNKFKDRTFSGLLFPCGTGKEQPLSSKILTKDGYIAMGDVYVGEKILDGKGKECTVTGVFPQGMKKVYKITFTDDTSIRVGEEHLNRFIRHSRPICHRCKDAGVYKMDLTTSELIKQFNTKRYDFWCQLPVCEFHSDYTEEELRLDPYLLGFLIGDGSLGEVHKSVSIGEPDLVEKIRGKVSAYDCHLVYSGGVDFGITRNGTKGENKIARIINDYALNVKSESKYIPPMYLFASVEQRLELLRGLFDSDGYINTSRKGGCAFGWSTVSKQLSDDFSFLVRSLGCVDKVTVKVPHYTKDGEKVECKVSYQHYIKVPNDLAICSSEKHLEKIKPRQSEPMRKIVSICEDGFEQCQCIMVDSEDHTYITDNVTVTHNTLTATRIAEEKERPVLIIAPNALCQQWADELLNKDEDTRITTKDWEVVVCTSKTKKTKKFRQSLDRLLGM